MAFVASVIPTGKPRKSDIDPLKAGIFFTDSINSVISLASTTGIQDEFVDYSIGMMLRAVENK